MEHIIFVLGTTTLLVSLVFVAYALSKHDVFFTSGKEGSVMSVVKSGQFHRFILVYRGFVIDRDGDVVKGKKRFSFNPFRWLEPLGIYWVGIPPFYSIELYRFRWTELKQEEDGTHGLWSRDEPTKFLYVNEHSYVGRLSKAIDKELRLINMDFVIFLQVTNPYQARYTIDDWLEAVMARILKKARDFVGSTNYEDLASETEEEQIGQALLDYIQKDIEEIQRDWGVQIKRVKMQNVALDGDVSAQVQEAMTAKIVAVKTGEATIAAAEAYRTAEEIRADGDAKATKIRGAAINEVPNGLAIEGLRTIEKAGSNGGTTILVPGNIVEGVKEMVNKN